MTTFMAIDITTNPAGAPIDSITTSQDYVNIKVDNICGIPAPDITIHYTDGTSYTACGQITRDSAGHFTLNGHMIPAYIDDIDAFSDPNPYNVDPNYYNDTWYADTIWMAKEEKLKTKATGWKKRNK